MTMGLACDSDGYDLRIPPCSVCGSRGCAKRDACNKTSDLPRGWLHRDSKAPRAARSGRDEVQEILRQLEPHSPTWVKKLRAYIAQLEARSR